MPDTINQYNTDVDDLVINKATEGSVTRANVGALLKRAVAFFAGLKVLLSGGVSYGETVQIGTADNQNVDFISNGTRRGGVAAGGGWDFKNFTANGTGSTSSTYSFIAKNGDGNTILSVADDGYVIIGGVVQHAGIQHLGGGVMGIDSLNGLEIRTAGQTGFKAVYNQVSRLPKGATIGADANADPSAICDIQSTTKGMLPPRMTTAQRDAILSPAEGLEIFNTTTKKKQGYNGSTWNDFY